MKNYLLRTSPPLTLRRSRATSTTSSDNVEHVSAVRLALNVDTLRLGTIGILCGRALQGYFKGWALQGYSAVGHCRDTLRLSTAGILGGWALQGYSAVGHGRDTLQLGTPGIFGGWALQGYSAVGHCRDIWRLGTAGILCGWALRILCGWALQGYSAVGHCNEAPGGRGQHRL